MSHDPESPPLSPIIELFGKVEKTLELAKAIHTETMAMREDQSRILTEVLKAVQAIGVIGDQMWKYRTVATNEALIEIARALHYSRPKSAHFEAALRRITSLVEQEKT